MRLIELDAMNLETRRLIADLDRVFNEPLQHFGRTFPMPFEAEFAQYKVDSEDMPTAE